MPEFAAVPATAAATPAAAALAVPVSSTAPAAFLKFLGYLEKADIDYYGMTDTELESALLDSGIKQAELDRLDNMITEENLNAMLLAAVTAMIVLFLFTLQCVDRGYCAFAADMGNTEVAEISGIAVLLCFVQILLRAIDIPFVYRFGSKKGSFVKLICMIVLTIILLALLFLNIDRLDTFFDTCKKVFSVQNSSLLLSVGLVVCLALYYLSYRITCRLYLKGVEQYDH